MDQLNIDLIKWDSDFFGYPVGELNFSGELPTLITTLRKAQAEGYKLIYLKSEKEISFTTEPEEFFSVGIVDNKIIYQKTLTPGDKLEQPAENVKHYSRAEASPELIQLALISGVNSRFARDLNFKNQEFERLYTEWIKKSVSGDIADAVWVSTTPAGKLAGMITLKKNTGEAAIGLLAVAPQVQGQGYGKKLLQAAFHQALAWNCSVINIGTQQVNLPANSLYQRVGFSLYKSFFIYHIWL